MIAAEHPLLGGFLLTLPQVKSLLPCVVLSVL